MGTVRRLATAAGDVPLGQTAEAYLGTLGGAEQASTPPDVRPDPPAGRGRVRRRDRAVRGRRRAVREVVRRATPRQCDTHHVTFYDICVTFPN